MAKKDKILDILSLASLSESAKISRLAHRWIGKPFPKAQVAAIVDCYFVANGRKPALIRMLMREKAKQEHTRNGRQAFADAAAERAKSPMLRYKNERARKGRIMEIAQRTFGQHVRENFNEDALALMSLISGEERRYTVKWLEASFKPTRSALIEVKTSCRVNPCQTNKQTARFLLYRINGRVLVARTKARKIQAAWAGQLPDEFMAQVPGLVARGFTFKSDLEGQAMVVTGPAMLGERRIEWTGRTVDDWG